MDLQGTVVAAISWAMFMIGITAVVVGNALDRWGPRPVFSAGALILATGIGLAAGHFGGPAFGTSFGSITLAHGLGTALGPWAAGFLVDRTGNYRETFVLAMLSLAMACAVTLILHRLPGPSRARR